MKQFSILALLAVFAAGLQANPAPSPAPSASSASPAPVLAPIPPADLASIQAALPAKATAVPKHPRKVLLFWRTEGFVHASIPYGVEALKQLGQKTGAYTSVSSADMAMFDPETLKQFDAVVFINSTQLKFENPVYRKALLDFVASGKGVVGIHAASDNFPTWPEGQALMGGVFHGHPWHAEDIVAVKLDDPAHPINKGFNNQGFRLQEEIYQITGPYGREKQHELLSLDMSKKENQRSDKDLVRTDGDFPISWVKKEGAGRVFYTSLGHNPDIYFVPQILQHYLDGIQYALGDLRVDDRPTAVLKIQPTAVLAPDGSNETLQTDAKVREQVKASGEASLKDLPKYNYGDSTEALFNVLEAIRKGTPDTRSEFGARLAALLQDPSTTAAARQTICRWLGWMGGGQAVPVLAKIAESASNAPNDDAGYAIRALATIPVKAADKSLIDLLASGSEDRQLAVMSAIRIRGTAAALPQLAKIAATKSPALSAAAFQTMASFRSAASLNAILNVEVQAGNSALQNAAVINAASGLLARGSVLSGEAEKRLAVISGSDASYAQRLSALRVLLSAHLPVGDKNAVTLLKNEDYRLRDGAAKALAELATPEQLEAISWNGSTDAFAVLLRSLTQRADPSFLPLFKGALGNTDENVRLAAIAAIAASGDPKGLDLLLPLLSDPAAPVAGAARNAILEMKGSGINERLLILESSSTPALAGDLLSLLAARQEHKAIDQAIQAFNSGDPALQSAGYKALSLLATGGDLSKCLPLLNKIKGSDSDDFQKVLVRVAILDPHPFDAAHQIATSFDQAGEEGKGILVRVLARFEVKEAIAKLTQILASPDPELRKQVIRALASERNTSSLTLLPLAALGQNETEKILALQGYIDTIRELPGFNDDQKVALYKIAWKFAIRNEEKEEIRSALSQFGGNAAARDFLKETDPKAQTAPQLPAGNATPTHAN